MSVSPATTYTYKTAGALEIQLDIYRQGGAAPRAALLWFHGGALIMGSRAQLPPPALCERLMQAGYALVAVDYRLAPETRLADIVQDIEDAYRWVLDDGPGLFQIDPGRIAIMGMSAGGYLALTTAARVSPKPRAVVSFYGYGDITGGWYTAPSAFYCDRYTQVSPEQAYKAVQGPAISGAPKTEGIAGRPELYLYCRQNGLWPHAVSGHDPAAEAAWFSQYEPLRNVTPDYPPTLLLHGEKDTDVPYEQSVLMAAEFQRHGVAHAFVSNPEWGHAFDYAEDDPAIPVAFDRVMRFLAEYLG